MQCSGGQVLVASWAVKQGAIGEELVREVPVEGGDSKGEAILEAACRLGSSSMVRLVGGAAAGTSNGRGVTALWGSSWQAAIASWS